MKCPLFAIGYLCKGDLEVARKCECGQEECAWWDRKGGRCSILLIALNLEGLANNLANIVNKLPREFTPRST